MERGAVKCAGYNHAVRAISFRFGEVRRQSAHMECRFCRRFKAAKKAACRIKNSSSPSFIKEESPKT